MSADGSEPAGCSCGSSIGSNPRPTIKRKRLPKQIFGTYQSTVLDTTEKKIPWYFHAFAVGLPPTIGGMWCYYSTFEERWAHRGRPAQVATPDAANGAAATVSRGGAVRSLTAQEYIEALMPRVPSMPWSAAAFDHLQMSTESPQGCSA